MEIDVRVLWFPKDPQSPGEYEDAFAISSNGRIAVADGVSSAIFSKSWARILTRALLSDSPRNSDTENLIEWLRPLRRQWLEDLNVPNLSWSQKQKLQQVGGAFATLLWADVSPEINETNMLAVRCCAIGDCCLFQIHDSQVLHAFPLSRVEDFDLDPMSIHSRSTRHDRALELRVRALQLDPADQLLVSSDAFAKLLFTVSGEKLSQIITGLWAFTSEQWTDLVTSLRNLAAEQRMRVDDTTVVLMRFRPQSASPEVTQAYVTSVELVGPHRSIQQAIGGPSHSSIELTKHQCEKLEGHDNSLGIEATLATQRTAVHQIDGPGSSIHSLRDARVRISDAGSNTVAAVQRNVFQQIFLKVKEAWQRLDDG